MRVMNDRAKSSQRCVAPQRTVLLLSHRNTLIALPAINRAAAAVNPPLSFLHPHPDITRHTDDHSSVSGSYAARRKGLNHPVFRPLPYHAPMGTSSNDSDMSCARHRDRRSAGDKQRKFSHSAAASVTTRNEMKQGTIEMLLSRASQ